MAIIVHYIGNDDKLGTTFFESTSTHEPLIAIVAEECLIDFRELIGQHSGENMAAAVWDTVQNFGITGRVKSTSFALCKTQSLIDYRLRDGQRNQQ
jgi:hypothetical protein